MEFKDAKKIKTLQHSDIQILFLIFFFFFIYLHFMCIYMFERKYFFGERTLEICGVSREKIINCRGTYGCADIIRVNYVRASIQRRGFFLSCR